MPAQAPLVLPAVPFAPDMPAFDPNSSQTVLNVIPRTPKSYGPMSSPVVFSGALRERCQGACAYLDSSGNVNIFAGDGADLYQLDATTAPNFSTVSKVTGTHPYTISADGRWVWSLFGQRVIATDFDDPMQSFVLGTSTDFTDLAAGGVLALTVVGGSGYTNGTGYALTASGGGGSGFGGTVDVVSGALTNGKITNPGENYTSAPTIAVPSGAGSGTGGSITASSVAMIAPQARYAALVQGFLVVGNTYDLTDGNEPQRVWWCALNDPTNWPTPGTLTAAEYQSDYNDLFGDGGWIQAVVGNLGTANGAVIMEHAVWRMLYVGPPAVFDFFPALGVKGCPAPGSVVQLGNLVYYLGEDGFYSFDGTNAQPIGAQRVDKWFWANVDQTNLFRIIGAVDPINKLVIWAAPFLGNTHGNPDHLIIYNWLIDRWSVAAVTMETLTRVLTLGYTLDELYTVLGYTLDDLPFSLDSRVWTGGNLVLSSFDTNHKLNFFNGNPPEATIDTAEVQPFPGRRALVKNSRPLVDGGTPSVAVGMRQRLEDAVVYGTPSALNALGTCPLRANGRYLRAEVTIPAGATWTHCEGVELDVTPGGIR